MHLVKFWINCLILLYELQLKLEILVELVKMQHQLAMR